LNEICIDNLHLLKAAFEYFNLYDDFFPQSYFVPEIAKNPIWRKMLRLRFCDLISRVAKFALEGGGIIFIGLFSVSWRENQYCSSGDPRNTFCIRSFSLSRLPFPFFLAFTQARTHLSSLNGKPFTTLSGMDLPEFYYTPPTILFPTPRSRVFLLFTPKNIKLQFFPAAVTTCFDAKKRGLYFWRTFFFEKRVLIF